MILDGLLFLFCPVFVTSVTTSVVHSILFLRIFSYFHSTDFLLKMQAINEKNGKKYQTIDIYFAP